jgi:hypothetical protein
MQRIAVPVSKDSSLWTVARSINEVVYAASKRGDRFVSPLLSRTVMRRLLKNRNERMATTALSYAGPIPVRRSYGPVEVVDIHSFITTNPISPMFSAFGHLFAGRLILDFMFQEADMDGAGAQEISRDIKQLLTS